MTFEGLNLRQRKEVFDEIKRHLKISAELRGRDGVNICFEWSTNNKDEYAESEVISECLFYLDDLPYERSNGKN